MKLLLLLPLLLVGCVTLNATAPLACREIEDVPGLDEEMLSNRDSDNVLKQLKMEPRTEKLRDYVIESSAICHGNKKLR